jgi:adenylate kinase family enzyme
VNRIAVIGCCGAGKTELSLALGARLGVPVIHLDQLSRDRGWAQIPNEVFARRQEAALAPDGNWIADGNYNSTMLLRLRRADTIVFLDFPTPLCLYRVVARRIRYRGRTRPDMAPDCPERFFDVEFPKFLHYVATFRSKQRPRILGKLAELAEVGGQRRVITLTSPSEAAQFLESLQ